MRRVAECILNIDFGRMLWRYGYGCGCVFVSSGVIFRKKHAAGVGESTVEVKLAAQLEIFIGFYRRTVEEVIVVGRVVHGNLLGGICVCVSVRECAVLCCVVCGEDQQQRLEGVTVKC